MIDSCALTQKLDYHFEEVLTFQNHTCDARLTRLFARPDRPNSS